MKTYSVVLKHQADYNHISLFLPITDMLWHVRSDETPLRVTCQ